MGFTPTFQQLPVSVQRVLIFAEADAKPSKILLFGSRARGDHRENSDYDIAFVGVKDVPRWQQFLLKADDEPWSLQKMDLVLFEGLNEDYRDSISKEGLVLYDRSIL